MARLAINTTRYQVMVISRAAFEEIETRLRLSNMEHPFHLMDTGEAHVLDMAGICLGIDPRLDHKAEPVNDLKTLLQQEKLPGAEIAASIGLKGAMFDPADEHNSDEAEAKRIAGHFPPMIDIDNPPKPISREPLKGMDEEQSGYIPTECPKCHGHHGNDWSQCEGDCPMPGSPHYKPSTDTARWPVFDAMQEAKKQVVESHIPKEKPQR